MIYNYRHSDQFFSDIPLYSLNLKRKKNKFHFSSRWTHQVKYLELFFFNFWLSWFNNSECLLMLHGNIVIYNLWSLRWLLRHTVTQICIQVLEKCSKYFTFLKPCFTLSSILKVWPPLCYVLACPLSITQHCINHPFHSKYPKEQSTNVAPDHFYRLPALLPQPHRKICILATVTRACSGSELSHVSDSTEMTNFLETSTNLCVCNTDCAHELVYSFEYGEPKTHLGCADDVTAWQQWPNGLERWRFGSEWKWCKCTPSKRFRYSILFQPVAISVTKSRNCFFFYGNQSIELSPSRDWNLLRCHPQWH